ncbi:MAG: 50S ribosomal protein L24 [Armatimonadota bacterium]
MGDKLHVKKGDTVIVIAGDDRSYADRRRQGKVIDVFRKTGRVVVEGCNIQIKHQRPTQKAPQGGRVQRPGPIDASNVMLVCPSCNQPTRIYKRVREDGRRVRWCGHPKKGCGKDID